MIHIGLFEGIGGFSLAAQWAGWETLATCEINPFGQRVLKHYWPNAYHHGDIKTLTYEAINTELSIRYGNNWRNQPIIITGGFPCQPYSLAGKRLGKEDDRHLWPEMLRVIREVSPEWVVGENVLGLVNWSGGLVFNEVQVDLEAAGYEVQPYVLPACAVNAPHKRERVWFIAYRTGMGWSKRGTDSNWQQEKRAVRTSMVSNIERFRKINAIAHSDNHGSHGSEDRQSNHQGDDRDKTGSKSVEQFEGCSCEAARTIANPNGSPTGNEVQTRGDLLASDVFTNTRCSERENWVHGQEQRRQTTEFRDGYTKFGTWSQFPITEPTICGRNDGFSTELDGITFPKWRNESIKAFGNAIVPQVAYQIFKAISEYRV